MNISRVAQTYGAYQNSPVNSGRRGGKAESKKDEYSPSPEAKDYQVARNALANIPDIREEKVKSIKSRIENGTYFVEANDIADKIFSQLNVLA